MKRILVDLGNATDLLYLPTLIRLCYKPNNLSNPGRVLVGFNSTQTHSLGEIVLLMSMGSVTDLVLLTVINEQSSFNTILGCT